MLGNIKMEIIFYITIFCIGTVFGSFFTLAVYRLPIHQDITHERSYCPKCNHKLSFWDMIPILSYIFLGGKCRYCKEKIRPRYLILEVCTGIVFLLLAISICATFKIIEVNILIYIVFALLYISGIIIIAGIDKENHIIHTGTLLYELIIISLYMIYLYIVESANVYRYVIYLIVILGLLINDTLYLKKNLKSNYIIKIIVLSIIMSCFSGESNFILTVIVSLLAIAINNIICKVLNKDISNKNIPIGYFLCCSNIVTMIITNFLVLGGYNG